MENTTNNQVEGTQIRQKRSFLKITLLFIVGFIIGWAIGIPSQKFLGSFALTLPLIFGIGFGIIGGKKKIISGVVSDKKLSDKEKLIVWGLSILNPVIFGGIFYFTWNNKYPQKAKQSNTISIVVFLAEMIIYGIYKSLKGEL